MVDKLTPPFVPPFQHTKMPAVPCRASKGHHQVQLQHSVITFGSPNVEDGSRFFRQVVEGVRTGSERVLPKDESRRCLSGESDGATSRRLQQLNTDLQQALQKLRQRDREETKLRRRLSVVQLKLEEAAERHSATIEHVLGLMDVYGSRMEEQRMELQRLRAKVNNCDKTSEGLRNEGVISAPVGVRGLKASAVQAENESLKNRVKSLTDEREELRKMTQRLQDEKEENLQTFSNIRNKLTADIMDKQEQIHQANKKLKELSDEAAARDILVQQVRLFVQMVCQPDFHVVKDTSLQPVDRSRTEPTGFVLVPLTLMLQGYSLLSNEDRDDLVELYRQRLT
ncbi:uncharacterized protein TEOVI_000880700 [Trypanosoma equiperdum]|uniref:Uncharacterized protein n=2 Tax=Trypanozoon TaxID=39700 RepID=Q38AV8_TRYB2|nr:hypothetical protein, conserved [Trypanosoma brucei brucei TREU927]EAN78062.1 hypothetical protein, conserved [Trypanosoma brucei brucei TREU927]SCU73205.1 hypothetical protein, conserved [Trypanosoma equiperdum]